MSLNSDIEWTEATWNPVTGCTQVSPGCAHCYAKTFAERFRGVPGHPYEYGFDLTLRPGRLEQPLQWKKARLIFVNSMSDLFHEDVPEEFIRQVFEVMAAAHWHTFQLLTKRSQLLAELVRDDVVAGRIDQGELDRLDRRSLAEDRSNDDVVVGIAAGLVVRPGDVLAEIGRAHV